MTTDNQLMESDNARNVGNVEKQKKSFIQLFSNFSCWFLNPNCFIQFELKLL